MTPAERPNSIVQPHAGITAAATSAATEGASTGATVATAVPLLEAEHLTQRYDGREVLQDINLRLQPGESLGIIGESGAGKSTLARLVMALERPAAGVVRWSGEDIHGLPEHQRRARRSRVQMVFQDPYSSLDPRWRVGRSVTEPLQLLPMTTAEREQRLAEVLAAVQLEPDAARRFPHQFSGGQRQRLAIARALATRPSLIVADEPLSALDVSVQAQILALLRELQRREGISLVLISHDLPAVEVLCDHALVLRHGQVVEHGASADVLGDPRHPYTRSLLSALA